MASIAAYFGASQAKSVAQQIYQKSARFNIRFIFFAVDG
jgi:hypothetical protein